MHMESALISTAVACAAFVSQTGAAGYSLKRSVHEMTKEKALLAGAAGAMVFAGQMINFAIPSAGSSGHIVGGIFLSFLLGPNIAFGVMALILALQCLMFGDGGLMALGCNILNMAFVSCYIAYPLIAKPIADKIGGRKGKAVGSFAGCIAGLELGALLVCAETFASGISELPFAVFAANMLPIHIVIGAAEGVLTAAALYAAEKLSEKSFRTMFAALCAAALVTGGCLSYFASSFPDGLEWSIENVTGEETLSGVTAASGDSVHLFFDNIQSAAALLPDYAIKSENSIISAAGTGISGITGCFTIIMVFAVLYLFKSKRASVRK